MKLTNNVAYAHIWFNRERTEHYQGVTQKWVVDCYLGTPKHYTDEWELCCGADTYEAAMSLADRWVSTCVDPCGEHCTSDHNATQ